MHKIDIPDWLKDHVVERRGTLHAFAGMAPARTALLVVDLQRGFMDPAVGHSVVPEAVEIVPNVNALARTVRETGGSVVFIRMVASVEVMRTWTVYYEDLTLKERRARRLDSMGEGRPGHALWPELEVGPADIIVDKTYFSAFMPGSSDLEGQLRDRGVDTVLVTGCVTNTCCESTARDAMMHNFRTVMIADANAARSDAAHNAALQNFYLSFGDVMTTAEAQAYLEANAGAKAASA
ncbi:MAG: cysteine hydrolase [Alphaproteobacteria bacterium]|nr:cysteine hydrolase [Alphaproteobacteria bacterium]